MSRFRAAPLLLFATAVCVCGFSAQNRANLEKARQDLQAGNFDRATDNLTQELRAHPGSAEVHTLLAYAYQKLNHIEDAIREYGQVIKLEPRSFVAHSNLGLLYLQQKDTIAAIRELRSAAAIDPANPNIAYNLSLLLIDSGQPAQALPYLTRVRQLEPDRPDAQFQTIRANLSLHRLSEARNVADLFVAGRPENTAAVGQLFLDAQRPADAIPYLQNALASGANQQDIRSLLSEAWLETSQPARVLELIPDSGTANDCYLRAQALFALDRFAEASAEAAKAVDLEPSNTRFLVLGARLYQRTGNGRAEELIDRAIQADPSWYEPYYSRSVGYYFQHNYDAAANNAERALRLKPECARCAFLDGVIRFNQGEMEKAESAFRLAVTLEPDSARFRTHHGTALMRSGRPGEASRELQRAISLAPSYALPHYELGKLLASASRLQDAAAQLEEARRLDPGLTQALYQLGQVYLKLGDQERAQQVLREFRETKLKEEQVSLREDLEVELRN